MQGVEAVQGVERSKAGLASGARTEGPGAPDFPNIVVQKKWGSEHEIFKNEQVACWYLKLNRDQQTSLHMHAKKETAMILLNGSAIVQEGLSRSRPIMALDKTRFSAGYFHRHSAITDCELLEIETPIDKSDVYRFKDNYGREGQPYEGPESFRPLEPTDPAFNKVGYMQVGLTSLRKLEFLDGEAFTRWARKLAHWSIVVSLRGSLRSAHGIPVVQPGHANWSHNLRDLLVETKPDNNMQVIIISQEGYSPRI